MRKQQRKRENSHTEEGRTELSSREKKSEGSDRELELATISIIRRRLRQCPRAGVTKNKRTARAKGGIKIGRGNRNLDRRKTNLEKIA